jgi:Hint domain
MPCFTSGIMVMTPGGQIGVDELVAGSPVVTRDNGIQAVEWVGRTTVDFAGLSAGPHLKPVLLHRGSLGPGLPERDMLVSPNHRILVGSDRPVQFYDGAEMLVAAKNLVDGRTIRQVDMLGVTYIHFLFTRHEVVLANGAWTESFHPGDRSLGAVGNAQRTELSELFPDLSTANPASGYQLGLRSRRRREALILSYSD